MRALISAVLILLSCGCATKPLISVDRNPNADLRAFKTFGFIEHPGTNAAGYSSIMTARLRAATRAQLERMGYTYDLHQPSADRRRRLTVWIRYYTSVIGARQLRNLDFLVEFGPFPNGGYSEHYFGLIDDLTGLFGRPVDLLVARAVRNPYLLKSINQTREPLFAAA